MGSAERCVDQESFTWEGREPSELHGKCWERYGLGELRSEQAILTSWEVLSAACTMQESCTLRRERAIWTPCKVLSTVWTILRAYLGREWAIWAPLEVLNVFWPRRAIPEEGTSYLSSMGRAERCTKHESFTRGASDLYDLLWKCWALFGPGELYLRRERVIWAPWKMLSAEWTRRAYLRRERAI